MESWNRSGRNSAKLLEKQPELQAYIRSDYSNTNWKTVPWKTQAMPMGSGLELVIGVALSRRWAPTAADTQEGDGEGLDLQLEEARLLFIALLLHPDRDKLSDLPCAYCDEYYIRKSARQTVYCSRKCAAADTAIRATKKRYRNQHVEPKLQNVDKLISLHGAAHRKEPWKVFVMRRSPEITSNFLTRHYTADGDRKPLTKGER